jgi:hypothetical protein
MKNILAILSLVAISSTALAGSYNFECKAYNLDTGTNEINKLVMSRDEATLDNYPGVTLDLQDPNIDLLDGEQTYVNSKSKVTLKAKVTLKSEITSLFGNLGRRDHVVKMYSATISVDRNGSKETFVGSCTETTITTCGGPCE